MKVFSFLILSVLILACNNETKEPSNNEEHSNNTSLESSRDTIIPEEEIQPEEVITDYQFVEIISKPEVNHELNEYTEPFSFVGWSDDGKIAYAHEVSGIGMGDWYWVVFSVQDVFSDKVVDKIERQIEAEDLQEYEYDQLSINSQYYSQKSKVEELYKSFGVLPQQPHYEKGAECTIGNDHYSFSVNNKSNDDFYALDVVVSKNNTENAILHRSKLSVEDLFGVHNMEIAGFSLNKDKTQAVIFVKTISYEIEGAKVTSITPVGCTFNKI